MCECQTVPTRSDTERVGNHADEHLRRFLAARRSGDAAGMRQWWEELVIDFRDRIDGLVAATHKGRLDDDEHELAVQLALIRFSSNLVNTFDGVSMGELVNATKTLSRGICMDVQRRSIRERRHAGPSLDSVWDDPRARLGARRVLPPLRGVRTRAPTSATSSTGQCPR